MPRNDEQLEERMAVSDKGETPAIVLTHLLVNDDLKVEFVYVAGGERALGHAEDEVAKFEKGKKHELEKLIFNGYGAWERSPEGDEQLLENIKKGTLRASHVLKLLYAGDFHTMRQSMPVLPKIEQESLECLEDCLQAAGTSYVCSISKGLS
ncbi:hypothetical protein N0V91_006768 [Didymella pomorum]|uniref:Uncharacterized protein n=1 Tax=Didymella pomorum TaxID=749634 RepID=A0A9W8ZEG0_9PLEO|nr:hypothetical protein N0V91_006768 [Didymella pomorum]